MAVVISDGELFKVVLQQTLNAQEVLNVFYFRFSGLTGASTVSGTQALLGFSGTFFNQLRVRLASTLTFNNATLTHLKAPEFEQAVQVYSVAGAVVSESLPNQCTIGIQLRTNSRVVRTGYKRISAVPETYSFSGKLVPASLTDWQDMVDAWSEPIEVFNDLSENVGNINLIVVSSKNWESDIPTVWRDVQQAVVQEFIGSQNSRKIGYGS